MVKRAASSQDAPDRSPKRTQLIDLVSDSESELPNLDFSRAFARSQRARESTQVKPEIARDSGLVQPEAQRVENEGDEEEAAGELGLELMDDRRDFYHQATVEADPGEPNGSAALDGRPDSPPLTAQSSDPRPASDTDNTPDNFVDAEPYLVFVNTADLVHSSSVRTTPAPVEAVATESPTEGAVGSHLTGPDHSRPTSDAHDPSCDAGPSNISNVDTSPVNSSGANVLPVLHEALATNCSTVHENNQITLAPIVALQSSAEQDEVFDRELAVEPRDQGNSVENEPHRPQQRIEEVDDSDDDDFDDKVMLLLSMLLIQLSESLLEDIADEQDLDYDDDDDFSGSEQGARQSIQDVQPIRTKNQADIDVSNERYTLPPTRTEDHAELDVANERHTPPPVAHTPERRDGAERNTTLPLNEATQGQRSHQQVYVRGNMRFTNCDQVNIASNLAQSGGGIPSGGAPLVVEGDMVFEGCKVVNILTPQDDVPSSLRYQHRPYKPRRKRQQPQPQPQPAMVSQHQVPSQHPPPAPPFGQRSQPNAPPRTFAQTYPPTEVLTQPHSYGPTLQFHTHDPDHSQAYHDGPSQAQSHTQLQAQPSQANHAGPSQVHDHAQLQQQYSQAYHAGPSHAQSHAQSGIHLWAQRHFGMPLQMTQAQRFYDPSQHVQQTVSDACPQAYSHPPQTDIRAQYHPTRRDETMLALEESRRWGRQALDGAREVEGDRYNEADDCDEDDDDRNDEDDEEYA